MNWYIGQEVFAIKTDSIQIGVVRGNEYKIVGLREPVCKCGFILIDIGVSWVPNPGHHPDKITCNACNTKGIQMYGKRWYGPSFFASIEQDISELTEHLENTTAFEATGK